eukprot:TRINITY_DN523_c0_g2_i2.p1 TRINITY_DN523_c0_g2~~TRINITY_DN523_c0_g2_i2.p1  ORF type:complete len:428 (-),score=82.14 TRINITY_DN523_c0_g2_i2:100-1383(-)
MPSLASPLLSSSSPSPSSPALSLADLRHVLEGFIKGFGVYAIPMSLLRRKVTKPVLRRSLATGAYVGTFRLVLKLLHRRNVDEDGKVPFIDSLLHWLKGCRYGTQPHHDDGTGTVQQSGDREGRTDTQSQHVGGKVREYTIRLLLLVLEYVKTFPQAVAGAAAAAIAIKVDRSLLGPTLVFWFLVRALRSVVPVVPYGDVVLMCVTAGHLLAAWTVRPSDIEPTYKKFLDRQGNCPMHSYAEVRAGCERMCVVHAGEECYAFVPRYWGDNFKLALKLYAPLYLVFFIFGQSYTTNRVISSLQSAARSSAFLASYCTLALATGCIYYRIFPGTSRFGFMMHGWTAGLATLIERPSRRPELAAYCTTYMFDSFYRISLRKFPSLTSRITPFATLVIILSSAIMFHHHDQQPKLLTKWLLDITTAGAAGM